VKRDRALWMIIGVTKGITHGSGHDMKPISVETTVPRQIDCSCEVPLHVLFRNYHQQALRNDADWPRTASCGTLICYSSLETMATACFPGNRACFPGKTACGRGLAFSFWHTHNIVTIIKSKRNWFMTYIL